jgi:hypothetical protein
MTLSAQISELLSYYINGETNRRCTDGRNGCYYSGTSVPHETEGCFIGKMLKPEDRIKADKYFLGNNDGDAYLRDLILLRETIGIEIPQIIMDNQELFAKLQVFHDARTYWINDCLLTESGIHQLKCIIKTFHLDEKDFEKFFTKDLVE